MGEPDLHAPGKSHASNQPEHNIGWTPRSTESEGLESANEPQTSSLVGSSPAMFSLDTNMDFLTFTFPNPSEDMGIAEAAPLQSDYHEYPVNHAEISSAIPLETGEFETVRSTTAESVGALSSPWPTRERRMTQVTNHVSYRFTIRSGLELDQDIKSMRPLKGLPDYCRIDADIDFRFTTSFGLAELPTPQRDSRKHLEICRILRSLTKSQSPTSNPKDSSIQSGPSLSLSEATIQRCVNACFESNAEIPMFLRKANVVKIILDVRESSDPDVLSSLFSNAIIAMGLDALRNPTDERRTPSIDGLEQFRSVLYALADLYAVPSSLLKLQSVIASNINDSRLSEMLSIGVNCARELRFTNSSIVRQTFTHVDDQKLVKRSVWFLYCLETSFSATRGIPPLLHSDFIDHLPTAPDLPEKHDALVLQVAAAALLARGFSRVYVQPISANTTTELQACTSELTRWRYSLSDHAKQLVAGRGFESLRGDDDAGAKLRLFCSYHECVYFLFGPWLPPLLESMPSPEASIRDSDVLLNAEAGAGSAIDRKFALADTLERCLESAYTIVSHANEIIAVDKTLAR
ncbi:hypothetical protein E0Z10_g7542 [Xylaria hypoxylon]|uniref:Transcription factor domain-containing protein n=1 Tax=Xylaria hypoxylon TaxID=37992 RepID=A0A4Z0YBA6_9PEZI|nr:hypothetical protein E0Z10_g7542 [Xylaria hypoxylon]